MIYIVVTPVNGTGDIAESQKCWDCVSVGLWDSLDGDGVGGDKS